MRKLVLLISLCLSIAYATNPCTQYKNIKEQCDSCQSSKQCNHQDRVHCAQLNNYYKQCHHYTQDIANAKSNTPDDRGPQGNPSNTPDVNLQHSFDSATPDTLNNNLHSYKNDITDSKPMPEVVAPQPKMPEGTPIQAPSATDNIMKAWY